MYGDGTHIVGDQYYYANGTSMACPHAAGVAALVASLRLRPEFSNEEIRSVLKASADPLQPSCYLGQGRINAYRAVTTTMPPPRASLLTCGTVYGSTNIMGTAKGTYFKEYFLYYGNGSNPSSWTLFYTSSTPVDNGILCVGFDTTQLLEGQYTIKLEAKNTSGNKVEALQGIVVNNLGLTRPMTNDVLSRIYGKTFTFITHPQTGQKLIVPEAVK